MANQIVVSAGAKVRNLSGVLTATSGVVSFLPIDVSLGIPQLDVNGKILVSQLPNSVMEYKGTWSAATNTPTLANGTGNQGDVYLCNVAGTVDFGAGPIAFFVGDQVIYSGSIWQRASGATGTVTSVAITESGDSLNITGSPITTSGTINIGFNGTNLQYVNGAGNLTTFPILTGYVTAVSGTAPVVSSGGTTPAISMAAATGLVDGYLLATDFAIFSAKQSALTFSSPLVNTSGTISIPAATTSVNGYLASADFTTFNNKQNAITLTTTGSSGVSTLVGATLNIPDYGSALTGYVPYTGATANVDLGVFDLTADLITGATGSFASSGGSDTFAINHSSGSGIALNITKGGNGEGLYINKTSGSGNAATIVGTLEATTLVKSGGTSSQFLKADGTVDSNTYALDSAVVHNTGNETIGGTKTFSDATKNNGGIFLQNASSNSLAGYMNIGGLTNGVKFTSGGGISNTFTLPSATGYTFTFPSSNGTVALTSDLASYVPYTGATASVDLGAFLLTASGVDSVGYTARGSGTLSGYLILKQGTTFLGNVVGYNSINANARKYVFISDVDGTNYKSAIFELSSLTNNTDRTYTLPDASGTIALVGGSGVGTVTSVAALTIGTSGTDLSSTVATSTTTPVITLNVPTASATNRGALSSADWTTFNNKQGTITLTTTGTSGVATLVGATLNIPDYGSALGGYLPLTGGTLTGILNINLSSGNAMNVAGNAIFRGDTGVGTPRQLIITSGGSTPVYLEAKGYGANYQTDFGIKTFNSVGTAFEVFYATSSGLVGINQTSPAYLLDVNGTFGATSAFLSSYIRTDGSAGFKNTSTGGTAPSALASYSQLFFDSYELKVRKADGQINTFRYPSVVSTQTWDFNVEGYLTAQSTASLTTGSVMFANSVGKITQDNAQFFWDDTNNRLGIGTSSPSALLHLSQSTANLNLYLQNTSGSGKTWAVNSDSNGSFNIHDTATNRLTITSGGNVLIGTTTDSGYKLDVNGTGRFKDAAYFGASATGDIFVSPSSGYMYYEYPTSYGGIFRTQSGVQSLLLAASGAATFSSTIDLTGNITTAASSNTAYGIISGIQFKNSANSGNVKAKIVSINGADSDDMGLSFQTSTNSTNVSEKLRIVGSGAATFSSSVTATSYITSSDYRLKNTITPMSSMLDKIALLKPCTYNLNADDTETIGFIAHEVAEIIPLAVIGEKDGEQMQGIDYSKIVAVLVKAIQELKAEIDTLKNK